MADIARARGTSIRPSLCGRKLRLLIEGDHRGEWMGLAADVVSAHGTWRRMWRAAWLWKGW